jgi:hypothetical protein
MQEKNTGHKGRRGVKAQNTKRKGEGQVVLSHVLIRIIYQGVLYIKVLLCK